VNLTGWSRSLEVTADGEGIVSHTGLAVLRQLADKTGLTSGLSRALATQRLLIHDGGRVTADLACAIADGAEVISDFRVIGDREDLFGLVALVPTAWRTLAEIAAGGDRALSTITTAVKRRAAPRLGRDRSPESASYFIMNRRLTGACADPCRPPAGRHTLSPLGPCAARILD